MSKRRIITMTVQDKSGVLNRITGLLSRRHYNISSISVGPTQNSGISKITIEVEIESAAEAEQITKQLNKQINVLKVNDITDSEYVERELALIKVTTTAQNRAEVHALIEPFRTRILDVARDSITVEVTGRPEKIDAVVDLLRPYGIKDMSRTGLTVIPRGSKT